MLLSVLLGFLAASLLPLCRKAPRAAFFTLGAGILLLALAGSSFLASVLLGPLQTPYLSPAPPLWGRRNAILLLGAGNQGFRGQLQPALAGQGRILETARLYRECRSRGRECTVVVSGGDPQRMGASEAWVYGQALLGLGVAREDLRLEERSLNTFQNAQFSAPILRSGGYEQVLVVTSASHLGRAQLCLSHFGIRAQPRAGGFLSPPRTWFPTPVNMALSESALHEYGGRIQYRLYEWAGRNPPRVP